MLPLCCAAPQSLRVSSHGFLTRLSCLIKLLKTPKQCGISDAKFFLPFVRGAIPPLWNKSMMRGWGNSNYVLHKRPPIKIVKRFCTKGWVGWSKLLLKKVLNFRNKNAHLVNLYRLIINAPIGIFTSGNNEQTELWRNKTQRNLPKVGYNRSKEGTDQISKWKLKHVSIKNLILMFYRKLQLTMF